MEGGIAPSLGMPVFGSRCSHRAGQGCQLTQSCSRLHRLQRLLIGGNYTATMEGKWGRVFFRDQLDTAWSFLIRETNYFCCTEKTRGGLHGFLVSYNGVARLPSVFCSAVIFYTILLKSRALSPIFVIFFPRFFLLYNFQSTVWYFSCALLTPSRPGGFLPIWLAALPFILCNFMSGLFTAACGSIQPLILFEKLAH